MKSCILFEFRIKRDLHITRYCLQSTSKCDKTFLEDFPIVNLEVFNFFHLLIVVFLRWQKQTVRQKLNFIFGI